MILNFRHFIEQHILSKKIFETINTHLAEKGFTLPECTLVDETIIAASTSTKISEGARDPNMHQTKKGKEWHHGMKLHISVDDGLGLIHSVTTQQRTSMTIRGLINCCTVKSKECRAMQMIRELIA